MLLKYPALPRINLDPNTGTSSLRLAMGPVGPQGATGPTGPPGGSDPSFAAWINDTASQTNSALAGLFVKRAHVPVNVLDYGTTDTQVRAAAAAAVAQGRGIHFSGATYNISGNLTFDLDGLAITGDGEASVLNFTDGGLVIDGASTAHSLRNTLTGLQIKRTGSVGPALNFKGAGAGTGVARWTAIDVHVSQSTGQALLVDGSYTGTFVGCYFRGSATGIEVKTDSATSTVGGNLLTFMGGETQGNTVGMTLNTTAGITFVGHGVEGNTTSGVELAANARAVAFLNCYFEANGGWDIKAGTSAPGGVGLVVKGGYVADGAIGKTSSINLIRGEAVSIEDVLFAGFGANSPVAINEASSGAVKGVVRNCKTDGSASVLALNGATRFGETVIGRPDSTPVKNVLRASAVLDFPSIAAQGSANLTITVTGAAVGDDATCHYNGTPPSGLSMLAWVSATDTVTVRATNVTGSAIDPAAATIRAIVWKF